MSPGTRDHMAWPGGGPRRKETGVGLVEIHQTQGSEEGEETVAPGGEAKGRGGKAGERVPQAGDRVSWAGEGRGAVSD